MENLKDLVDNNGLFNSINQDNDYDVVKPSGIEDQLGNQEPINTTQPKRNKYNIYHNDGETKARESGYLSASVGVYDDETYDETTEDLSEKADELYKKTVGITEYDDLRQRVGLEKEESFSDYYKKTGYIPEGFELTARLLMREEKIKEGYAQYEAGEKGYADFLYESYGKEILKSNGIDFDSRIYWRDRYKSGEKGSPLDDDNFLSSLLAQCEQQFQAESWFQASKTSTIDSTAAALCTGEKLSADTVRSIFEDQFNILDDYYSDNNKIMKMYRAGMLTQDIFNPLVDIDNDGQYDYYYHTDGKLYAVKGSNGVGNKQCEIFYDDNGDIDRVVVDYGLGTGLGAETINSFTSSFSNFMLGIVDIPVMAIGGFAAIFGGSDAYSDIYSGWQSFKNGNAITGQTTVDFGTGSAWEADNIARGAGSALGYIAGMVASMGVSSAINGATQGAIQASTAAAKDAAASATRKFMTKAGANALKVVNKTYSTLSGLRGGNTAAVMGAGQVTKNCITNTMASAAMLAAKDAAQTASDLVMKREAYAAQGYTLTNEEIVGKAAVNFAANFTISSLFRVVDNQGVLHRLGKMQEASQNSVSALSSKIVNSKLFEANAGKLLGGISKFAGTNGGAVINSMFDIVENALTMTTSNWAANSKGFNAEDWSNTFKSTVLNPNFLLTNAYIFSNDMGWKFHPIDAIKNRDAKRLVTTSSSSVKYGNMFRYLNDAVETCDEVRNELASRQQAAFDAGAYDDADTIASLITAFDNIRTGKSDPSNSGTKLSALENSVQALSFVDDVLSGSVSKEVIARTGIGDVIKIVKGNKDGNGQEPSFVKQLVQSKVLKGIKEEKIAYVKYAQEYLLNVTKKTEENFKKYLDVNYDWEADIDEFEKALVGKNKNTTAAQELYKIQQRAGITANAVLSPRDSIRSAIVSQRTAIAKKHLPDLDKNLHKYYKYEMIKKGADGRYQTEEQNYIMSKDNLESLNLTEAELENAMIIKRDNSMMAASGSDNMQANADAQSVTRFFEWMTDQGVLVKSLVNEKGDVVYILPGQNTLGSIGTIENYDNFGLMLKSSMALNYGSTKEDFEDALDAICKINEGSDLMGKHEYRSSKLVKREKVKNEDDINTIDLLNKEIATINKEIEDTKISIENKRAEIENIKQNNSDYKNDNRYIELSKDIKSMNGKLLGKGRSISIKKLAIEKLSYELVPITKTGSIFNESNLTPEDISWRNKLCATAIAELAANGVIPRSKMLEIMKTVGLDKNDIELPGNNKTVGNIKRYIDIEEKYNEIRSIMSKRNADGSSDQSELTESEKQKNKDFVNLVSAEDSQQAVEWFKKDFNVSESITEVARNASNFYASQSDGVTELLNSGTLETDAAQKLLRDSMFLSGKKGKEARDKFVEFIANEFVKQTSASAESLRKELNTVFGGSFGSKEGKEEEIKNNVRLAIERSLSYRGLDANEDAITNEVNRIARSISIKNKSTYDDAELYIYDNINSKAVTKLSFVDTAKDYITQKLSKAFEDEAILYRNTEFVSGNSKITINLSKLNPNGFAKIVRLLTQEEYNEALSFESRSAIKNIEKLLNQDDFQNELIILNEIQRNNPGVLVFDIETEFDLFKSLMTSIGYEEGEINSIRTSGVSRIEGVTYNRDSRRALKYKISAEQYRALQENSSVEFKNGESRDRLVDIRSAINAKFGNTAGEYNVDSEFSIGEDGSIIVSAKTFSEKFELGRKLGKAASHLESELIRKNSTLKFESIYNSDEYKQALNTQSAIKVVDDIITFFKSNPKDGEKNRTYYSIKTINEDNILTDFVKNNYEYQTIRKTEKMPDGSTRMYYEIFITGIKDSFESNAKAFIDSGKMQSISDLVPFDNTNISRQKGFDLTFNKEEFSQTTDRATSGINLIQYIERESNMSEESFIKFFIENRTEGYCETSKYDDIINKMYSDFESKIRKANEEYVRSIVSDKAYAVLSDKEKRNKLISLLNETIKNKKITTLKNTKDQDGYEGIVKFSDKFEFDLERISKELEVEQETIREILRQLNGFKTINEEDLFGFAEQNSDANILSSCIFDQDRNGVTMYVPIESLESFDGADIKRLLSIIGKSESDLGELEDRLKILGKINKEGKISEEDYYQTAIKFVQTKGVDVTQAIMPGTGVTFDKKKYRDTLSPIEKVQVDLLENSLKNKTIKGQSKTLKLSSIINNSSRNDLLTNAFADILQANVISNVDNKGSVIVANMQSERAIGDMLMSISSLSELLQSGQFGKTEQEDGIKLPANVANELAFKIYINTSGTDESYGYSKYWAVVPRTNEKGEYNYEIINVGQRLEGKYQSVSLYNGLLQNKLLSEDLQGEVILVSADKNCLSANASSFGQQLKIGRMNKDDRKALSYSLFNDALDIARDGMKYYGFEAKDFEDFERQKRAVSVVLGSRFSDKQLRDIYISTATDIYFDSLPTKVKKKFTDAMKTAIKAQIRNTVEQSIDNIDTLQVANPGYTVKETAIAALDEARQFLNPKEMQEAKDKMNILVKQNSDILSYGITSSAVPDEVKQYIELTKMTLKDSLKDRFKEIEDIDKILDDIDNIDMNDISERIDYAGSVQSIGDKINKSFAGMTEKDKDNFISSIMRYKLLEGNRGKHFNAIFMGDKDYAQELIRKNKKQQKTIVKVGSGEKQIDAKDIIGKKVVSWDVENYYIDEDENDLGYLYQLGLYSDSVGKTYESSGTPEKITIYFKYATGKTINKTSHELEANGKSYKSYATNDSDLAEGISEYYRRIEEEKHPENIYVIELTNDVDLNREKLLKILNEKGINEECIFVGHNSTADGSDISKIENQFGKFFMTNKENNIDTLVNIKEGKYSQMVKDPTKGTVSSLARQMGIEINAHEATSDAEATFKILLEYIKNQVDIDKMTSTYYSDYVKIMNYMGITDRKKIEEMFIKTLSGGFVNNDRVEKNIDSRTRIGKSSSEFINNYKLYGNKITGEMLNKLIQTRNAYIKQTQARRTNNAALRDLEASIIPEGKAAYINYYTKDNGEDAAKTLSMFINIPKTLNEETLQKAISDATSRLHDVFNSFKNKGESFDGMSKEKIKNMNFDEFISLGSEKIKTIADQDNKIETSLEADPVVLKSICEKVFTDAFDNTLKEQRLEAERYQQIYTFDKYTESIDRLSESFGLNPETMQNLKLRSSKMVVSADPIKTLTANKMFNRLRHTAYSKDVEKMLLDYETNNLIIGSWDMPSGLPVGNKIKIVKGNGETEDSVIKSNTVYLTSKKLQQIFGIDNVEGIRRQNRLSNEDDLFIQIKRDPGARQGVIHTYRIEQIDDSEKTNNIILAADQFYAYHSGDFDSDKIKILQPDNRKGSALQKLGKHLLTAQDSSWGIIDEILSKVNDPNNNKNDDDKEIEYIKNKNWIKSTIKDLYSGNRDYDSLEESEKKFIKKARTTNGNVEYYCELSPEKESIDLQRRLFVNSEFAIQIMRDKDSGSGYADKLKSLQEGAYIVGDANDMFTYSKIMLSDNTIENIAKYSENKDNAKIISEILKNSAGNKAVLKKLSNTIDKWIDSSTEWGTDDAFKLADYIITYASLKEYTVRNSKDFKNKQNKFLKDRIEKQESEGNVKKINLIKEMMSERFGDDSKEVKEVFEKVDTSNGITLEQYLDITEKAFDKMQAARKIWVGSTRDKKLMDDILDVYSSEELSKKIGWVDPYNKDSSRYESLYPVKRFLIDDTICTDEDVFIAYKNNNLSASLGGIVEYVYNPQDRSTMESLFELSKTNSPAKYDIKDSTGRIVIPKGFLIIEALDAKGNKITENNIEDIHSFITINRKADINGMKIGGLQTGVAKGTIARFDDYKEKIFFGTYGVPMDDIIAELNEIKNKIENMQEEIDNAKIDKTKILYGINLKYKKAKNRTNKYNKKSEEISLYNNNLSSTLSIENAIEYEDITNRIAEFADEYYGMSREKEGQHDAKKRKSEVSSKINNLIKDIKAAKAIKEDHINKLKTNKKIEYDFIANSSSFNPKKSGYQEIKFEYFDRKSGERIAEINGGNINWIKQPLDANESLQDLEDRSKYFKIASVKIGFPETIPYWDTSLKVSKIDAITRWNDATNEDSILLTDTGAYTFAKDGSFAYDSKTFNKAQRIINSIKNPQAQASNGIVLHRALLAACIANNCEALKGQADTYVNSFLYTPALAGDEGIRILNAMVDQMTPDERIKFEESNDKTIKFLRDFDGFDAEKQFTGSIGDDNSNFVLSKTKDNELKKDKNAIKTGAKNISPQKDSHIQMFGMRGFRSEATGYYPMHEYINELNKAIGSDAYPVTTGKLSQWANLGVIGSSKGINSNYGEEFVPMESSLCTPDPKMYNSLAGVMDPKSGASKIMSGEQVIIGNDALGGYTGDDIDRLSLAYSRKPEDRIRYYQDNFNDENDGLYLDYKRLGSKSYNKGSGARHALDFVTALSQKNNSKEIDNKSRFTTDANRVVYNSAPNELYYDDDAKEFTMISSPRTYNTTYGKLSDQLNEDTYGWFSHDILQSEREKILQRMNEQYGEEGSQKYKDNSIGFKAYENNVKEKELLNGALDEKTIFETMIGNNAVTSPIKDSSQIEAETTYKNLFSTASDAVKYVDKMFSREDNYKYTTDKLTSSGIDYTSDQGMVADRAIVKFGIDSKQRGYTLLGESYVTLSQRLATPERYKGFNTYMSNRAKFFRLQDAYLKLKSIDDETNGDKKHLSGNSAYTKRGLQKIIDGITKDIGINSIDEVLNADGSLKEGTSFARLLTSGEKVYKTEVELANRIVDTVYSAQETFAREIGEPIPEKIWLYTPVVSTGKEEKNANFMYKIKKAFSRDKSKTSKEKYRDNAFTINVDEHSSALDSYSDYDFMKNMSKISEETGRLQSLLKLSSDLKEHGGMNNVLVYKEIAGSVDEHMSLDKFSDIGSTKKDSEEAAGYSFFASQVRQTLGIEVDDFDGTRSSAQMYINLYNKIKEKAIDPLTGCKDLQGLIVLQQTMPENDSVNKAVTAYSFMMDIVGKVVSLEAKYKKTDKSFVDDIYNSVMNNAKSKGLVLTDRFGRKYTENVSQFPKLAQNTTEDLIWIVTHSNDIDTEGGYKANVVMDILRGDAYFMDETLSNKLQPMFVRQNQPAILKTLNYIKNIIVKLIMANPVKLPSRAFNFTGFDFMNGVYQNGWSFIRRTPEAINELSAYMQSKGAVCSDDLKEFIATTGVDPLNSSIYYGEDSSVKMPISSYFDTTSKIFTGQHASMRFALFKSLKSDIEKANGDPTKLKLLLGNSYYLKDQFNSITGAKEGETGPSKAANQAALLISNGFGTFNDMPYIASQMSKYGMAFTTFPMALLRFGKNEVLTGATMIKEIFTMQADSATYKYLARRVGSLATVAGLTYGLQYLLLTLFSDMSEEEKKEYVEEGSSVDIFQTLFNGDITMNESTLINPFAGLRKMTIAPFKDGIEKAKENDQGLLKGITNGLLGSVQDNIYSHINPAIGAVANSIKGNPLNKYSPQGENFIDNLGRNAMSYAMGTSGANAFINSMKTSAYDDDQGFFNRLARAASSAVAAEAGNMKSYKSNWKNYNKAISLVYDYKNLNTQTASWINSGNRSTFDEEQYTGLKATLRNAMKAKAKPVEIYDILQSAVNNGAKSNEIKAALRACSLKEQIAGLKNRQDFYDSLSDKEWTVIRTALAYENTIFPSLAEYYDDIINYENNDRNTFYKSVNISSNKKYTNSGYRNTSSNYNYRRNNNYATSRTSYNSGSYNSSDPGSVYNELMRSWKNGTYTDLNGNKYKKYKDGTSYKIKNQGFGLGD